MTEDDKAEVTARAMYERWCEQRDVTPIWGTATLTASAFRAAARWHIDRTAELVAERDRWREQAGELRAGWQSIETAPKDGAPVLIAAMNGNHTVVGEASCESDGEWWWANTYGEYWADPISASFLPPTHWMPLPEPPA